MSAGMLAAAPERQHGIAAADSASLPISRANTITNCSSLRKGLLMRRNGPGSVAFKCYDNDLSWLARCSLEIGNDELRHLHHCFHGFGDG